MRQLAWVLLLACGSSSDTEIGNDSGGMSVDGALDTSVSIDASLPDAPLRPSCFPHPVEPTRLVDDAWLSPRALGIRGDQLYFGAHHALPDGTPNGGLYRVGVTGGEPGNVELAEGFSGDVMLIGSDFTVYPRAVVTPSGRGIWTTEYPTTVIERWSTSAERIENGSRAGAPLMALVGDSLVVIARTSHLDDGSVDAELVLYDVPTRETRIVEGYARQLVGGAQHAYALLEDTDGSRRLVRISVDGSFSDVARFDDCTSCRLRAVDDQSTLVWTRPSGDLSAWPMDDEPYILSTAAASFENATADDELFYWQERETVLYAKKGGGEPQVLAETGRIHDLETDGCGVYWTTDTSVWVVRSPTE